MPFDVFISHSRKDKAVAEAVCAKLEAEKIRCWIAPRDIPPGADWADSIMGALESCRVMILIFSSDSNASTQVKREVEHAFNNSLTVVPFRIEDVKPNRSLNYYIGSVHWLDALTEPMERHIARLLPRVKAITETSARPLAEKDRFDGSGLPAETQPDLQVRGRGSLALVRQPELEGELLEKLAAAAHEVFCDGKKRDGWKYAPKRDNAKKFHPLLIPYEQLPETYKESNRVTVRNIPKKLARAGYVMIPSRSNEPPLEFPGVDLEALAEYEHELWMADKVAAGFTLGKSLSVGDKKSEYIVPWNDVPEPIKQIDRDLIRGIPRILAKAGYAVVKLHAEARTPSA